MNLSRNPPTSALTRATGCLALALLLLAPGLAQAHDPDFTETFNFDNCTFTATGNNPYFPLWPGYVTLLEGEEEDDGEIVEVSVRITVLADTEMVNGVLTRVIEEFEEEDGELLEISRNFFATCRETGDVWYFGEDVDIYEDGVIVSHDGEWRAGEDGATPGVLIPGSPMIGARHFQEVAPGIALDQAEIISLDTTITVPTATYDNVMKVDESSPLDLGAISEKWYAPGVGLIKDNVAELVSITPPPCQPDDTTLCLSNGRFEVKADWTTLDGNEGDGMAILPSADSGEFWFFNPNNTELIVKVLDACDTEFNNFWVFAAGMTNVELTIEVTDTQTGEMREYDNPPSTPFAPVLDTGAFATCP